MREGRIAAELTQPGITAEHIVAAAVRDAVERLTRSPRARRKPHGRTALGQNVGLVLACALLVASIVVYCGLYYRAAAACPAASS